MPLLQSMRRRPFFLAFVVLLFGIKEIASFAPSNVHHRPHRFSTQTNESWRDYVPLAVSSLVIVDVLLGSPAANSVLGIIRKSGDENDNKSRSLSSKSDRTRDTKELVDSQEIAAKALEKAQTMVDLRNYLESNKSDAQRFAEMRAKMDQKMATLDEKLSVKRIELEGKE